MKNMMLLLSFITLSSPVFAEESASLFAFLRVIDAVRDTHYISSRQSRSVPVLGRGARAPRRGQEPNS